MKDLYVQYGCGLSAPEEWTNFDVSPSLRFQKMGLGFMAKGPNWPKNVKYGDITKGLPVPADSCKGVYCSHVLEHLSFKDFETALKNTYKILQSGGAFRLVVPDLEAMARSYVNGLDEKNPEASIKFVRSTLMGIEVRPRGTKQLIKSFYGNAHHLWMWDQYSLTKKLEEVGFKDVRLCHFNDSDDEMFKQVEDEDRFVGAIAIESKKN